MTFTSEVNLPDLPSAPSVKDLSIQKKSYVGFRYMPTSQTEKIGGDIICSITPLDISPLRSTRIDGRPFVLNPVGFTMYLIVRNKSDHIVRLEKSILQFEDSQGNEFPIALSNGWIESTSMFIDSIGQQYENRVNDILNEYKAQNMDLAHKLMPQINAIKDDNNRKVKQYTDFITSKYEPRFAQYEKEVEQYNRMNLNVKKVTGSYLQNPIEIEIDKHSTPASLIQNKQYECSQASFALDQASNKVESKIDQNAQAARWQMLAAIAKKRQEWKEILNSVQTNATKVVRGDGVFDPIVIPPGKHRTLLIPGIGVDFGVKS